MEGGRVGWGELGINISISDVHYMTRFTTNFFRKDSHFIET